MSTKFYDSLPFKVRLKPPGSTVLVAGKGESVDPLGWGIFKFEIGNKDFYHEVGVVKELPVDLIIGADLMIPHSAKLRYSNMGSNTLSFERVPCSTCYINLGVLKSRNHCNYSRISLHLNARFPMLELNLLNLLLTLICIL